MLHDPRTLPVTDSRRPASPVGDRLLRRPWLCPRAAIGWGIMTALVVAGCSDAATPSRSITREEFQKIVLSEPGLTIVAFTVDSESEAAELQRAATALQNRLAGQARWLRIAASDWTRSDWNIRRTPVLVAYEQGEEVSRLIGPLREQILGQWVDELASQQQARAIAAVDVPELVLTDANFDQQLAASPTPVLVDFWATWCGPCKAIAPHLRLIAGELEGRLQIAKVDIDQNRETAKRFVNGGIPLLVLMHDGREVDRVVGAVPPDRLRKWLHDHLRDLNAEAPNAGPAP